jgi:hypothetical protein
VAVAERSRHAVGFASGLFARPVGGWRLASGVRAVVRVVAGFAAGECCARAWRADGCGICGGGVLRAGVHRGGRCACGRRGFRGGGVLGAGVHRGGRRVCARRGLRGGGMREVA